MITNKDVDDFLDHAGVKGMKWGQRRAAKAKAKATHKMQKASRTHEEKRAEQTAVTVGLGAAYIASRLLQKRVPLGVALVGSAGVGIAGARFTKSMLERDRIYTAELAGE